MKHVPIAGAPAATVVAARAPRERPRALCASRRPLLLSLLVAAIPLAGCHGPTPSPGGDEPAAALRVAFPGEAPRVLGGPDTFAPTAAGFVRAAGPWNVTVTLPADATAEVRFEAPNGFAAGLREIGATGTARRAAQAIAYDRPAGTSYWAVAPGGAEEWLLVGASAVHRGEPVAAWEVDGPAPTLTGSVVEIKDADGVPRIRATAPAAYAAGGRTIGARLDVRGSRVELSVDADAETVLVDPVWTATTSMAFPRAWGTATLLPSGKVLVAGGNFPNANAEVYNPGPAVWAATGAMTANRDMHQATLLPSGKVLVTGGASSGNGNGAVATAEVYDPGTNAWTATAGPMAAARENHTATLLTTGPSSGKVLVAGGAATTATELYDPTSNKFTTTAGALSAARSKHSAVRLNDGRVIVLGGNGSAGVSLAGTERYDPVGDTWTTVGSLVGAREGHIAVLLPDGRVVAADGIDMFSPSGGQSIKTAELYDPVSATWSATASTAAFHDTSFTSSQGAVLLGNGKVLLSGGSAATTVEVFDPASGTWLPASPMQNGHNGHTATLLADNTRVLVAGGVGPIALAEIYTPIVQGAACTQAGDCASGFCVDGVCCNTACNGACIACSVAAGAPADGTCAPIANGTACNDGNACTQTDTCQAGVCTGGNPVLCAASDQCHLAGVCNPGTGICSNPAAANGTACNDGNACTQTDTCQAGACTGGNPVACAASDQCHVAGVCNPGTGMCSNPAAANGTICNDGNACTQTDTCQAGACTGGNPVVCAASDQCHVAGACNPGTGMCSNPAAANGTSCNDGNACTQTDTCQSGACTGGNPVVCAPIGPCHVAGVCNAGTGMCSSPAAADGTACDDGNACTLTDTCQSGACVGSSPVTCAPPDQCHQAASCDPVSGSCDYPNQPDGTPCTTTNMCVQNPACIEGTCVSSTAGGCSVDDIGLDVPPWASTTQPCQGVPLPSPSCDNGGFGDGVPNNGVVDTVLRPFMLDGLFALNQCGGAGRALSGGAVYAHNTNLTAFDFAGNGLGGVAGNAAGGNSDIDTANGVYTYLLARDVVPPSGPPIYLDYSVDSAEWDYGGGTRSLVSSFPGAVTSMNTFTAPPTGDETINLVDSNLVSVRYQVTSTTPCVGIGDLQFTAAATDGADVARFGSSTAVPGTLTGNVLSPDPATVNGFVGVVVNPGTMSQQYVATGELLVEPGHIYAFGSASVLLTDGNGVAMSHVALPQVNLAVPPNQCATLTVALSIAMPPGRTTGTMSLPNSGAGFPQDPVASVYRPPFYGYSVHNAYNGNWAAQQLAAGANQGTSYNYRAQVLGRWGEGDAAWNALVAWPGSFFGPGGATSGWFRWPLPGTFPTGNYAANDAFNPLQYGPVAGTSGIDLDGFYYLEKLTPTDDPLVQDSPLWPPWCPTPSFNTETVNFGTPMAFVDGTVNLLGCAATNDIASGVAGLSGTDACISVPAQPNFTDEFGFSRPTHILNTAGLGQGVFKGGHVNGDFEIAVSQGAWLEGGYDLQLRRAGAYVGELAFWKPLALRGGYDLAAGRPNAQSASLVQATAGQVTTHMQIIDPNGNLMPFRSPEAFTGSTNFTDPSGSTVLGTYYASSYGSATLATDQYLDLIGLSRSAGNVRYLALVPYTYTSPRTGLPVHTQVWAVVQTLFNVPMDVVGCQEVCVTIQRGTSGNVTDAACDGSTPSALCTTPDTATVGGTDEVLLDFDTSPIPTSATVVSATLTLRTLNLAGPPTGTASVHPVTSPWTPATVTFASVTSSASVVASFAPAFATISTPVNTALVQQWVATPASNDGVLLDVSNGETMQVRMSEHIAIPDRPKLTVCYVP